MPKISLLTKVYINKIRSGRTSGEAAQNDGTEESKSTQPRLYENLPNPVLTISSNAMYVTKLLMYCMRLKK